MKNILFFVIIIGLWACSSKPNPNLELSNPEAFAFDLGNSWEVNASVSTKGFAQQETEDEFTLKLSYSVDLVTPNSDSLVAIYNDVATEKNYEEFMDFILEAQLEIDSSFGEGDYKIIFNVKDEYSKQEKSITVDFNLTK